MSRVQERVTMGVQEHRFLQAMINPFDSKPQRVPEIDPRPTAVSQVKFTVPVYSTKCADGVGRAMIVVRPSIDNCWQVSATNSDVEQNALDGRFWPLAVFNARKADNSWVSEPFSNPGMFPKHTEGGWAVTDLNPIPNGKADLMRNLYTSYRCTAAGMRFRWTNKLLEAKGDMVVANVPGTYGMFSLWNYLFTMNSTPSATIELDGVYRADALSPAQCIGLNFETLQSIAGARTGPAIHGAETVWMPSWNVLKKLRPTRYYPPAFSLRGLCGLTGSNTNYADAGSGNNPFPVDEATMIKGVLTPQVEDTTVPLPNSCSDDPDNYMSFFAGLFSSNKYLAAGDLTDTVAGVFNIPNVFKGGPLVTNETGEWSNSSASSMDLVRSSIVTQMHAYSNSVMAMGDEAMVMIFDGVPLNEAGDNGVEIGLVEIVMNFEGEINSRTLSLEDEDRAQLVVHPASEANLVKVATHVVPRGFVGEEGNSGSHVVERAAGTVDKIMDGVHHAVRAAPGLIKKGKDIWEAAAPILESIGLGIAAIL